MEWDDLRYVLAAARSGSFVRAANLLRVTHTTVGRRIRALETALGQPLFMRSRDGCTPTEFCVAVLLPAAADMEEQMRRVVSAGESVAVEPSGLVRLHTAGWIIETVLAPAVPKLLRRHPRLRISFVGDVVEAFTDPGTTTVHLRFDVMAKRGEMERPLGAIPFSVYHRADRDPDALPWVSNDGGNVTLRTMRWLRDRLLTEQDLVSTATDASGVRALIRAGVGKGLIPDYLGCSDLTLRRVYEGEPDLLRHLRIIYGRGIAGTPEFGAVHAWAEEALSASGVLVPDRPES